MDTKTASLVSWAVWLLFAGQALAGESGPAQRQGQDLVFHYGVVPAPVVLAHPDQHPERKRHGGKPSKGDSHLVVALFNAQNGQRVADADVSATVTLLGAGSVTKGLEPMRIAGQPSFGAFFSFGTPGIYRIRFEARRPGVRTAAAEFEYRVAAEGRR